MTHDRAGMIRKLFFLSFAFFRIFGGVLYYTRGRAQACKRTHAGAHTRGRARMQK